MREAQQAEINAQQEGGGAAGEEVMDGRHVGGLEQTAGEVRRQGGLLPPLPSLNRTAEIEGEFAKDKAERKRKYYEWRQKVNGVLEKLEAIIVEVIRDAPVGSRTRRLARCELKALQRLREGEANEAVREEAHMEEATKRMRTNGS
jgi:hypothetical protein